MYLVPRTIFRDPFRGGDNIIVMADAYIPPSVGEDPNVPLTPIPTNTRHACMKTMDKVRDEDPWFGIEQVWCQPLLLTAPCARIACDCHQPCSSACARLVHQASRAAPSCPRHAA